MAKAKNRIILASAAWLALCGLMFGYLFSILENSNKELLLGMQSHNRELAQLESEQESYNNAKRDLNDLSRRPFQPQDLFGKDVTLVNEIKALEVISQDLGVDLVLSGVSGTIKSAPKAKTLTDMATIPYSLNVTGEFSDIVSFMEHLENQSFVTNVTAVSLRVVDERKLNAVLSAHFYLSKQ